MAHRGRRAGAERRSGARRGGAPKTDAMAVMVAAALRPSDFRRGDTINRDHDTIVSPRSAKCASRFIFSDLETDAGFSAGGGDQAK